MTNPTRDVALDALFTAEKRRNMPPPRKFGVIVKARLGCQAAPIPTWAWALLERAAIWEKAGQERAARFDYERVIERIPSAPADLVSRADHARRLFADKSQ